MPNPTLTQIRTALGAAIDNISGLTVLPRATGGEPPLALVELLSIEYHLTAEMSSANYHFRVTVLVGMVDLEAAQLALDAYLEPNAGIRQALEADLSLGGVVSDVIVRRAEDYQPYELGGQELLGCRLLVDVIP